MFGCNMLEQAATCQAATISNRQQHAEQGATALNNFSALSLTALQLCNSGTKCLALSATSVKILNAVFDNT
jgi:hypothetical protein